MKYYKMFNSTVEQFLVNPDHVNVSRPYCQPWKIHYCLLSTARLGLLDMTEELVITISDMFLLHPPPPHRQIQIKTALFICGPVMGIASLVSYNTGKFQYFLLNIRDLILGDDALLYIAYVMLIWVPLTPATRWSCSRPPADSNDC